MAEFTLKERLAVQKAAVAWDGLALTGGICALIANMRDRAADLCDTIGDSDVAEAIRQLALVEEA